MDEAIPPAELHSRRLKAARIICGYESAKTFAEDLATPGLGFKTLANVESGSRELKPHEIAHLAEFCGLPRAFFVAPKDELGPASEGEGVSAQVLAEIRAMRKQLAAITDDEREPGA